MVWLKDKVAALGTRLGVLPGEGPMVARLAAVFAIYVFTLLLGRTVRDSLFLNAGLSKALPAMYVGSAITVILSAAVAKRLTAGKAPLRQTQRITTVFGIAFVLIYSLLASGLEHAALLLSLYFWVEIVGALLMVQFWAIANDHFDPRQAKRLYSLITAGQVLGNLACGAVAGLLTPYTGTQGLLVVLAGTLLVSNLLLPTDTGSETPRPLPAATAAVRARAQDTPETRRFIGVLILLSVLTFVTTSLVDFQFKLDARSHFSHDELTRFFGLFYGGVGACAFFVQIFFSNYLVRTAGLFGTLAIMPAGFVLFGAARTLVHNFWVGTALKFDEHLLRYSLNDPLSQLLVIPLPNHRKRDIQQLLGGTIKPAAIGLAGLVLVLLSSAVEPETLIMSVASLSAILAMLWLGVLYRARSLYVQMLANATQRFRQLSVPDLGYLNDPKSAEELARLMLREQKPHTLGIALSAAENSRVPVAGAALSQLCLNPELDERLRARALSLLDRTAAAEGLATAQRLLASDDVHMLKSLSTLARFILYRHGQELPAQWDQLIHSSRHAWSIEQYLQVVARRDSTHKPVPAAVLSNMFDAALDRLHDPTLANEAFYRLAQLVPTDDLVREADELMRQSGSESLGAAQDFAVRVWRTRLNSSHRHQPLSEAERKLAEICQQAPSALLRNVAHWAALESGATGQWQQALHVWPRLRNAQAVSGVLRSLSIGDHDSIHLELLSRPMTQLEISPRQLWPQLALHDPSQWLIQLEQWQSTAVPAQPLLQRSLHYAAVTRMVWLLRWAAVHADSRPLLQLAQHAIVARPHSRATLIEVVDQELDHPSKARMIVLLEKLRPAQSQANYPVQLWNSLPWSVHETIIQHTGSHILYSAEVPTMDNVERIVNLASVDLFRELPIQSLARIAAISASQPYLARTRIIEDGAQGDSLYLLVDGEVEVQKGGKTLVKLARGACFGEMSLLDDQPRSADVVAASDCRCLRIDRDDFEVLLMDEPAIGRAIMSVLTARLRAANAK